MITSAVESSGPPGQPAAGAATEGRAFSRTVARASAWVVALRIGEKTLTFARTVILARLLAPDDFGLFGIALIALATLEVFSQPGLQTALVQREGELAVYLDSAWTVQVLRGFLLSAMLFLVAPWIAAFFDDPRAISLLRLLSLVPAIRGLENVGMVYVQRGLEFQRQFVYSATGSLLDTGLSIGLALAGAEAWALGAGLLIGTLGRTVASYLIHPYRPRLRRRWRELRELTGFSLWVYGSNVLAFLALRGDNAVVGKLLGPVALGTYELAFRASELLTREIATVVSTVSFPAYSRLQDDLPRIRRAYHLGLEVVAAVTLPVATFTSLLATSVTSILLGPKWHAAAAVLPYLVVAGAIRALAAVSGSVLMAVGQPRLNFQMHLLRVLVTVLLIVPLTRQFGLVGTGSAVMTGALLLLPMVAYYNRQTLQLRTRETVRALAPGLILSAAVGTVVWLGSLAVAPARDGGAGAAVLLLLLSMCAATYVAAAFVLWRVGLSGPWSLINRFVAAGWRSAS